MDNTVYSVKNISVMLNEDDEMLLYGQFLDSFFKRKTVEEKCSLLEEEPIYDSHYELFFCILAGSVEKLAHDHSLPVPEWTEKPEYYLGQTYYAFDTQNPDFQKFLIQTTPNEYRKRNLMVGDSVLKRC